MDFPGMVIGRGQRSPSRRAFGIEEGVSLVEPRPWRKGAGTKQQSLAKVSCLWSLALVLALALGIVVGQVFLHPPVEKELPAREARERRLSSLLDGLDAKLDLQREQSMVLSEASSRCQADHHDSLMGVNCAAVRSALDRASRDLRIYIFDLPATFNVDFYQELSVYRDLAAHPNAHAQQSMSSDIFEIAAMHPEYAAEVRVHEALLHSRYRTLDPDKATMFYLPLYSAMYFWHAGWDGVPELKDYIRAAYAYLRHRYPRFVRPHSKGKNILLAMTHDVGASAYWPHDIPTDQFIFFGAAGSCHITMPPCCAPVSRYRNAKHMELKGFDPPIQKTYDVFFEGSEGGEFRDLFKAAYERWSHADAETRHGLTFPPPGHPQFLFGVATACFVPRRWTQPTWQEVATVFSGCIPVSFGVNKSWPFHDFIRWKDFTINIPQENAAGLSVALDVVARSLHEGDFVRAAQHRLQYVWPLLALLPSSVRSRAEREDEVLDAFALFIAEVVRWLP